MSVSLHQIGEALYGPRWQSELARALDVSDRTVRRWAAGGDMPDGVMAEVRALCLTREKEIREIRKML